MESLPSLQVGDHLYFGAYEQDHNPINGSEAIEWRVLHVDDDGEKALLISEDGLAFKRFNETYDTQYNYWANSDLFIWLLNEFEPEAFSSEEQQRIDSITCLSKDEAERYFRTSESRICKPSHRDSDTERCSWWLRSGGGYGDYNSYHKVTEDGHIFEHNRSNDDRVAVRPAIWVLLDSEND